MRTLHLLASAVLLPCIAACSLVTDLNGLSGGAHDALDAAAPSDSNSNSGSSSNSPSNRAPDAAPTNGGSTVISSGIVIASEQSNPTSIAVDDANVYWTNDVTAGSIVRAPLVGGSATVISSAQDSPASLAVGGGVVYWSNASGDILNAPTTGASITNPKATAHLQGTPSSLVVSGSSLWWTDALNGMVHSCDAPTSGCPDGINMMYAGDAQPTSMAIDNGSVWWLSAWSGGRVEQCMANACTGTSEALVENQAGIHALAIDATNVYWTMPDRVLTASRLMPDGGAIVTTLASGMARPWGIAVDATDVYFTNLSGGTVMKVSKSGGDPIVIASSLSSPWGIAVDATNVYFTSSGDGRVLRAPK
jgi:hypothetical protein